MANQKTRLGEISGGSIHPRDVIPPLMQELREVGGDDAIARALQGSELGSHLHHDTMDWFGPAWRDYSESDDAAEDVVEILDELNNHAPPFTYYGTHPGDGACYGLWADVESAVQAVRDGDAIGVEDLDEIPDDYCGLVLLVNDRGNATLYWCDTEFASCSGLEEIWTVV